MAQGTRLMILPKLTRDMGQNSPDVLRCDRCGMWSSVLSVHGFCGVCGANPKLITAMHKRRVEQQL